MYKPELPDRSQLPSVAKLTKQAIVAALAAIVLLVTIVLPAEYAVDPTGVGRMLTLTEMGEIKQQLAAEAEADKRRQRQMFEQEPPTVRQTPASDQSSSLLGRVFAALIVRPASAHESGHGPDGMRMGSTHPAPMPSRNDEMSLTLKPGQGAEIKMRMAKGAQVRFSWIVEDGTVNFDAHGDGPGGLAKSYKKGRSVGGDEGVLEAAFDGSHGWFWRNRTRKPVTVRLRTNGEYLGIRRMM